MRVTSIALLLLASSAAAQELPDPGRLRTVTLRESALYDEAAAGREVLRRIQQGVYDHYAADLCVDDLTRCEGDVFAAYRQTENGVVTYRARVSAAEWSKLPPEVQFEIVQEILDDSWGHRSREHPALATWFEKEPAGSPLDLLSPTSASQFLTFSPRDFLEAGKGGHAYGPNCWYNAISAIADDRSVYAKSRGLASGTWDSPRFMGPTEFRCHMKQFSEVSQPAFGDLLRYYTDEPVYQGLLFGGEAHGATYVGRGADADTEKDGAIVLTKNGRSNLDFLIFQDVRGLDASYLPKEPKEDAPVVKKAFLRVNTAAPLLDPAKAGTASDCYAAYQIDLENYEQRWACLAGDLDPPPGDDTSCYSYPLQWRLAEEPADATGGSTGDAVMELAPPAAPPHPVMRRDNPPLTAARPLGG